MITGSQAAEHELVTIRAFVAPNRKERFLGFLAKPQTRKKFIKDLNHFCWFDPRFAAPVVWKVDPSLNLWPRHLQGIENIFRMLQSKGAGKTCWVMSENRDLDGREVDLEWVLEKVVDQQMGTILSCIPGKLALFVGEDEMLD